MKTFKVWLIFSGVQPAVGQRLPLLQVHRNSETFFEAGGVLLRVALFGPLGGGGESPSVGTC